MANKLELTWYGKDEPIRIEPRLLIENTALSNTAADPDTDNMLIHGDNLLALKALETQFAGQVKCIYIDPPYNIGAMNEYYEDLIEHSLWLNRMRPRIEILRNLLCEEGVIFIQISDEEQAYLKILCDEIFGRRNFINMISVNMKNAAGASGGGEDKKLKKNCEFVLTYAKNYDSMPLFNGPYVYTEMSELIQQYLDEGKSWKYTTVLVDPGEKEYYGSTVSKAIEDGYTRTPFAVTRSDIDFYNFGDEQLDKMMLLDGISCHENTKRKLEMYAVNNSTPDKPLRVVKPFMLVVCKDTTHAAWVEEYIRSDEFRGGAYRNKTIVVHSKQKGAESDANTRLLLDVESAENPVEVVIHVNMLKEGWDVNNLYTIVPLRTAASKILREQMVGRGLRLPYGERTGDRDVDAVMLTAHDKFADILEEAQKGDSIFKAGNVIKAEEIVPEQVVYTQLTIETEPDKTLETAYQQTGIQKTDATDALLKKAAELINQEVTAHIQTTPTHTVTPAQVQQIADSVKAKVADDKDLGDVFKENEMPLAAWMLYQTEETHRAAQAKFIPIPRIKVTDIGVEEYVFVDFDLDMAEFTHMPIKNELLVQNLEDMQDRQRIKGDAIDFEGYNPKKVILEQLRTKPEIDYEKCSTLLFKLITQLCDHYNAQYGDNGMRNIVMMYKRDIGNKIYKQMMQHFYCENGFLQEEVVGTRDYNLQQSFSYKQRVGLYESYTEDIRSVLFDGIKKDVFSTAKFDSHPELLLARVLESDGEVQNWLRPAPREFNITYNHGHNYEPDFVVETEDVIYLVEVKGEDKLNDPDVIAKKKRGIQYCEVATRWGKANGYKEWRYLFIPSKQVMPNSSFMQLARQFCTL